jgi:hypothetical protein
VFLPPISLERILQVFVGEDIKSRSSDCFSVLASSGLKSFEENFSVLCFWPLLLPLFCH